MKLVMTYSAGDGYTYWCEVTKPFEYESLDKAEYDFLDLCEKSLDRFEKREFIQGVGWTPNSDGQFYFAGEEFNALEFFSREDIISKRGNIKDVKYHYEGPMIRTLEQWFEQEKIVDYK